LNNSASIAHLLYKYKSGDFFDAFAKNNAISLGNSAYYAMYIKTVIFFYVVENNGNMDLIN